MISRTTSHRTLRAIALLEAAKGLLVLAAGFGLLSLLHRDLQALAVKLIGHLHLHPGRKYAGVFVEAAARVTDKELRSMAALAAVYSIFRLVEGYGLWRERAWAEWLALASGMIYLPIEIYGVFVKFTCLRISILTANILVVVLIAQVLWRSAKTRNLNPASLSE